MFSPDKERRSDSKPLAAAIDPKIVMAEQITHDVVKEAQSMGGPSPIDNTASTTENSAGNGEAPSGPSTIKANPSDATPTTNATAENIATAETIQTSEKSVGDALSVSCDRTGCMMDLTGFDRPLLRALMPHHFPMRHREIRKSSS